MFSGLIVPLTAAMGPPQPMPTPDTGPSGDPR